jgi:hypothetical protein
MMMDEDDTDNDDDDVGGEHDTNICFGDVVIGVAAVGIVAADDVACMLCVLCRRSNIARCNNEKQGLRSS